MNRNNSNDVIEISDDSDDVQGSNSGSSSLQGTKRQHSTTISSDSSDDSSSNSDVVEWIQNDSESEPDFDCDGWDDDCKILDIKPKTPLISGFHLMPTCSPDPETRPKKAKQSVELNSVFTDVHFKKLLKDNFDNDNGYCDKACEIICDPWKVLVLNDVLRDASFLEQARQEMYEIDWNRRCMDLYEFFQSEDLKDFDGDGAIEGIREFLRTDLKEWVEYLTGMEITEVSATCSFYGDTDFLVLHDDQRDNRAVAFVLYLTGIEGWNGDWGGALQLFDRDGGNQPDKCTRSVVPKNNQLVLFPVSHCSYHQVEEVTCKNFTRMSINGWFHVKEPLKFETPLYVPPQHGLFSDTFETFTTDEINLLDWVESSYLTDGVKQSIQYYMEETSEHSLETFFNEEKMDELCKSIADKDIKWERMGPPNRRNYEYICISNLPPIVDEFLRLFKMEKFAHLLKEYTDLELTKMKWELQKWTPGCYSLLEDDNKNRLDVVIFLGTAEVIGGKTHYVTLEDEVQTALVSIHPSSDHSLNMVYGDTARYTSFVSRHTKTNPFYMLVAAYFEDEN